MTILEPINNSEELYDAIKVLKELPKENFEDGLRRLIEALLLNRERAFFLLQKHEAKYKSKLETDLRRASDLIAARRTNEETTEMIGKIYELQRERKKGMLFRMIKTLSQLSLPAQNKSRKNISVDKNKFGELEQKWAQEETQEKAIILQIRKALMSSKE